METDRWEDRWNRRRGVPGIALGGIIVLVGLALLLENMGIVHVHDLWRFWPLWMIIWGASRCLSSQTKSGYVWGGAIALIGVLILLDNLDIIVFNFGLIWPLALIAGGVGMLVRSLEHKNYLAGAPATGNSAIGAYAVFSGVKQRIESQDFKGGDCLAVFGGVHIDLRRAAISSGTAVIDVNALFGGVEVFVPEEWTVNMKGMGIFGAFEDKTIHPKPDPNVKVQQLVITGYTMFGGCSVKN